MVNPNLKWNKKDNLNKLLSLLKKHKVLSFKQLRLKLRVSEPTLAEYIKALEQDQQIEHFYKHKDRRYRYYRIRPENQEKVDSRIRRYEAINFIASMPNPVFVQKGDNYRSIAGFTWDPTKSDKQLKEMLEKSLQSIALRFLPKALPNQKTAIVIMIAGDKT